MSEPARDVAVKRVGRLSTHIVQSTFEAVEELEPVMDELRKALSKAKTLAQAKSILNKWVKANSKNAEIAEVISGPAMQAEIAGQLMVDVHETEAVKLSAIWTMADASVPAFLDMPWRDAIDWYNKLEEAGKIPRGREFEALSREYLARGEEARQLFLERIRAHSLQQINTLLEEGGTLRDYTASINEFTDNLGVGRADPSYLETIQRTNTATAYGAGKARVLEETKDIIGHWIYRAVGGQQGDGRTRPTHAAMSGMIFEIGNPATDGLMPPNGYNCRCSAVPHELEEGESVQMTVPENGGSDPGFVQNPMTLISHSITG